MPNGLRVRVSATVFSLAFASIPLAARADGYGLSCTYKFYGIEFATVAIQMQDGALHERATITHQGRSHTESATLEAPQAGESLRITLSKESPENDVEMIVYAQRQPEGDSKLVNPHVPAGKIMWGDCRRSVLELLRSFR